MDLAKPVTSLKFGELTGISRRRVEDLKSAGILVPHSSGRGLAGEESIRGYCSHLRQIAAGRQAREAKTPDLKAATAALREAQKRHYDLKNAAIEGELVPLCQLQPAWNRVTRAVRSAVLAIPGRARFALPHLTVHDASVLEDICRDQLEVAALGDKAPQPDEDVRE
jgi:terminase small subunit / prophage DNA-packing protein